MASEEPRSRQDAVDTGCNRASSAAPECSSYSPKMEEGMGKIENFSAVKDIFGISFRKSPNIPAMPSIEIADQMATISQATLSDSATVPHFDELIQSVHREPEVKSETGSSQKTVLSDIPVHTLSPENWLNSGPLQKGTTSSAETLPTASDAIRTSADPINPETTRKISLGHVRDVARSIDPEKLEAGVSVGLAVLAELQSPLMDAKQHGLLAIIENIKKKGEPARTIVAVAGATGAGKSSLINALLNEEKLLPTNGMRGENFQPAQSLSRRE